MTERKSLEESSAVLYGKKRRSKGGSKIAMWVPDCHAGIAGGDDITFFKTHWEDSDLSNQTLPRRYINRSGFTRVNFSNTDLNQIFMCMN